MRGAGSWELGTREGRGGVGGVEAGGSASKLENGKGNFAAELNRELCQCRQLPRRWRASSTPDVEQPHGQDQQ